MIPSVQIDAEVKQLLLGVVAAHAVAIGPSGAELRGASADVVQRVQKEGMAGGEPRREAIRRLLRAGGFKPAGRNKPAQEYLLRTATETGELPSIFNAVDWLNVVSLESGLPISVLSARQLGPRILIRYGQAQEKFVFNRTGQELELEGLICVCSVTAERSIPLGTPIKDSMAGKIGSEDAEIVAFLYASLSAITTDEFAGYCEKLGRGFQQYCGAASYETAIVRSTDSMHDRNM